MIRKYFALEAKKKTVCVQARIPAELAKNLEAFKKAKHLSWNALILGSLQALDDEIGKKK